MMKMSHLNVVFKISMCPTAQPKQQPKQRKT